MQSMYVHLSINSPLINEDVKSAPGDVKRVLVLVKAVAYGFYRRKEDL